jgi:hypothetical protein
MRLTKFVQLHKNLGWALSSYSILPQRIFSIIKARKTVYIKQSKQFRPVILSLSPACQQAIASDTYSAELSRLIDVAIAQAETPYELEFAGLAS